MWWILEKKFQSTLNRSIYHKRKRIKKKNKNRLHRISRRRNREDKIQNKFAYRKPIVFHEYTQPEEEFIRANTYLELIRDVNGNPFLAKGNFSYGEMLVLTAASKEEENKKEDEELKIKTVEAKACERFVNSVFKISKKYNLDFPAELEKLSIIVTASTIQNSRKEEKQDD